MRQNLTSTPDKPGVYLLKDEDDKILYVGKAVSLKKRLKSYSKYSKEPRINSLIDKIAKVDTFEVESEIEALILEANLIKKYKPPFNVQLKDDKDYLYIIITKDKYPKVLPARRRSIVDAKTYFGPFPSAVAVRKTLKTTRRIFPYSTCSPNKGRACLSYHIRLCPGICIDTISEKKYKQNILKIKMFLQGKKKTVIDRMRKEMEGASSKLRYEEALEVHKKLQSLEYILQPVHDVTKYVEEPEFLHSYHKEELKELQTVLGIQKMPRRIEGYDISNIRGEFATGSMVVFIDGKPDKGEYRKFRIKKVRGISDTDMMEEVLTRRFKNDWRAPDLIIVDGGKGQLSACMRVLKKFGLSVPCAALAKRLEQIFVKKSNEPIKLPTNSKALHLIQRLRDEAHRFAISYHRHLRKKDALTV